MTPQKDYSQVLLEHNIKPSYQRMQILGYLDAFRNHPTVETIYQALVKNIPTLSRTTIYNNLKLFASNGLVRVLNIEDTEAHYDSVTADHGHFKCENCGCIQDFSLREYNFKVDGLENYQIYTRDIYFKGLCPACLEITNIN